MPFEMQCRVRNMPFLTLHCKKQLPLNQLLCCVLYCKPDCHALVSSGWPDQPTVPREAKRLRPLSGVWLRELENWYLFGYPSRDPTLWSQPGLRQCGVCLSKYFLPVLNLFSICSNSALNCSTFFLFLVTALVFSVNTDGSETFLRYRKRHCRHLSNQKLWTDPTSTSASAAKRNAMLGK